MAGAALTAGMRAQLEELGRKLALGVPRLGWKVGFNDPAFQRRMGLDGFLVGALDGSQRMRSGETYRVPGDSRPSVEAEVAVHMMGDLGGNPSAAQAWAAIGALAPAIEVVDYARPSEGISAILTHSIFHAASVIGEERPPAVFEAIDSELPVLSKNGRRERGPEAALRIASLGAVVARLAAILEAHGERLRSGDWILTGSWVNPAPVAHGDHVVVDFGALGEVNARFEAE